MSVSDKSEQDRSEVKERVVQLRVSEDQLQALRRKAKREGDTVANWARRTLLKDAGWEYDKTSN